MNRKEGKRGEQLVWSQTVREYIRVFALVLSVFQGREYGWIWVKWLWCPDLLELSVFIVGFAFERRGFFTFREWGSSVVATPSFLLCFKSKEKGVENEAYFVFVSFFLRCWIWISCRPGIFLSVLSMCVSITARWIINLIFKKI